MSAKFIKELNEFRQQLDELKNRGSDLGWLRTERRLRLQYVVTRVLAETSSLPDAVHQLLQSICVIERWHLGMLWRVDRDKRHLRLAGEWHSPSLDASTLVPICRRTFYPEGTGLPGSVWASGKPMWISEAGAFANWDLAPNVAAMGLHALSAFPLRTNEGIVGVVTLFSRENRKPDNDLLQLVGALGQQIGEMLNRKAVEEKVLEQARRFRALIENSSDAIALIDTDFRVLYMAPSAERILGYATEDVVGRGVFEFIDPGDSQYLRELVTSIRDQAGKSATAQYRFRHRDGSWRWLESVGTNLLADPSIRAIVLNSRDITDRKDVQEQFRRVEAVNRELEAFTYSVSHDLRAPLRAIVGFSRILVEEFSGGIDPEAQRLLNIVRNGALRMGELIDNLLAFSRIGRQPLSYSGIDMTALATSVTEDLKEPDSGTEARVTIRPLPEARGDPALIRQVFVNLISNALKFSKRREIPAVEIGGCARQEKLLYYVKDNGVGFDMQYRNKLFGVFQRLHSDKEFEGTGVGLAIVKRIIDRHGGEVSAEATVGGGATFYFTLPR